MKKYILLVICSLLLLFSGCTADVLSGESPAVIFLIGDGMGQEQIDAASYYYFGEEGSLSFEQFPVQGTITTYSADSSITDSAAAATALATGRKVYNGVISKALPGFGWDLTTILEHFQKYQVPVGLITTTAVTHATPAAFASHVVNRGFYTDIANQYFNNTKPNIIMGGGGSDYGITDSLVTSAGYALYDDPADVQSSDAHVAVLMGDGHLPYEFDAGDTSPGLTEMVSSALTYLENEDNFFLLVEAGRIDHAGHSNDLERLIGEVGEFSKAVQLIVDWAETRDDIIVIVTADHETGGLSVTNNGKDVLPSATWTTTGHTGVNVPYFVWGAEATSFSPVSDNTDFFSKIISLF